MGCPGSGLRTERGRLAAGWRQEAPPTLRVDRKWPNLCTRATPWKFMSPSDCDLPGIRNSVYFIHFCVPGLCRCSNDVCDLSGRVVTAHWDLRSRTHEYLLPFRTGSLVKPTIWSSKFSEGCSPPPTLPFRLTYPFPYETAQPQPVPEAEIPSLNRSPKPRHR